MSTLRATRYFRAYAVFYVWLGVSILLGMIIVGLYGALGHRPGVLTIDGTVGAVVGWVMIAILLGVYVITRRSAVRVTAEGIEVVPFFGRARTYPWAAIAEFDVREYLPWYYYYRRSATAVARIQKRYAVVVARLRDGRYIELTATQRRPPNRADVARARDVLNASRPGGASRVQRSVAGALDQV